jgi:PIN domain nuclease of toxin-antitoxin system
LIYLLDACALFAYIKKEPEGVKVKKLFERAGTGEIAIRMSIINLTEVYEELSNHKMFPIFLLSLTQ